MNEPEYKCPHCKGDNISFIRIRVKDRKLVFRCNNPCQIEFETEEMERVMYLVSEVSNLSNRYP